MAYLTSRQRVLTALAHEEPDRVPYAIGGGSYGLVDDVYFKLLKLLSLGNPVEPFRLGHNISYMDDRLLDRLGTDIRYVYPGDSPSSPNGLTDDPNTFLDGYGQVWKRAVPYFYADQGILKSATHLDQINQIVKWPDVNDPRWVKGVAERARSLRENTECFISARMVTSHGPYQTACDLRGTENFMFDMLENEDFASALLHRISDTLTGLTHNYLAACGSNVDMIELPGDDYAGNQNLIISPRLFRKFIRPILERMVSTIRAVNPGVKIMLHSDGAIEKLIPDFIEIGINVLHPLEPLPANDHAKIKQTYGKNIAFIGGIDISHAIPGSLSDVENEVRRRIKLLAANGGYILAPSNHIQADVPAENVVKLCAAAREFGAYPIL
jgi:uroporphyrinogen decarboxylase